MAWRKGKIIQKISQNGSDYKRIFESAHHGFVGKFSAYKINWINLHLKRHARANNVIGNNFIMDEDDWSGVFIGFFLFLFIYIYIK